MTQCYGVTIVRPEHATVFKLKFNYNLFDKVTYDKIRLCRFDTLTQNMEQSSKVNSQYANTDKVLQISWSRAASLKQVERIQTTYCLPCSLKKKPKLSRRWRITVLLRAELDIKIVTDFTRLYDRQITNILATAMKFTHLYIQKCNDTTEVYCCTSRDFRLTAMMI